MIVYGLAPPVQSPTYDKFVESIREKMSEAYDLVHNSLSKVSGHNGQTNVILRTVCLLFQPAKIFWSCR